MRTAYRVLAYLIVAEVIVQAAAIAYGVFGLSKYVDDGAVLDKASQESGATFDGVAGLIVHGINGQIGVPLIGLALLVVSFFTHVRDAVQRAVSLFVLILVQVALGIFAHQVPALGALHGLTAIGIALSAWIAAVKLPSGLPAAEPRTHVSA